MQLHSLQGLNVEKLEGRIGRFASPHCRKYKAILADENKVMEIVRNELSEIADKYSDARRTEISLSGTISTSKTSSP